MWSLVRLVPSPLPSPLPSPSPVFDLVRDGAYTYKYDYDWHSEWERSAREAFRRNQRASADAAWAKASLNAFYERVASTASPLPSPEPSASERDLPLNANELNLLGETPPGYREADEQEVLL